jgi:hypothetical protein
MSNTQMFNIANRLYPGVDYWSLTKEQMSNIMEEYHDWN